MTSILPTAGISPCALPGRFQLHFYFSKFPSRFSVCLLGRANHFIQFVFEFLLRPSIDPSWELQSCALPGWFQWSNHFSKPPSRVLVCESGHSVRSGSFIFETLIGTRTLHPQKLLLRPPLPVSITRLFLKALLLELSRANPPTPIAPAHSFSKLHSLPLSTR